MSIGVVVCKGYIEVEKTEGLGQSLSQLVTGFGRAKSQLI